MVTEQTTTNLSLMAFLKGLDCMADEFDPSMTLSQARAYIRIALAGEAGIPQQDVEKFLNFSASGATRIVGVLSDWQVNKDAKGDPLPGYGVVERGQLPKQRSFVLLKLTSKGQSVLKKIASKLSGGGK